MIVLSGFSPLDPEDLCECIERARLQLGVGELVGGGVVTARLDHVSGWRLLIVARELPSEGSIDTEASWQDDLPAASTSRTTCTDHVRRVNGRQIQIVSGVHTCTHIHG